MKKVLDFCEKYAPELLVVLVCVPAMIRLTDINSYHTFFYFTDYSTGFGGRKLLATFCDLWFPEVVSRNHILPIIVCVNTIMIGLFSWFCGKCVRQSKECTYALLAFISIYLLSPFSFVGFIRGSVMDFYICTLTLLFLYMYMKYRGKWYYYVTTIIILCVACLTHQIFCNIFFPLVFALFVFDVYSDEINRKKNLLLYALASLVLFVLFCIIIIKGTMNVDFETYYNYLQTRVGANVDLSRKEALYYNMYATLPEHISAYLIPTWKYNIARFTLTLIVFVPLWAMLWAPWIMAIRNAETKGEKWCYILMQFSIHVMILPAFIMAADYERWTLAYCFCQICLLMILYANGENAVSVQMKKLFDYAVRYKSVFLIGAVYISAYEVVKTWTAAPIVDFICRNAFKLVWSANEVLPF